MRGLVSLLLAIGLMGFTAAPVTAYHTLGGKWTSVTNLSYWYYTSVSVDRTAYGHGVTDWNGTPTPIWMIGSGRAGYEDVGLRSTSNSSVGWDGLTRLYPSNTANPYTYADTYLNDYYTNGYSTAKRQSVSEHEQGHVFGLAHTSGAVLMNPYTCGSGSRWRTYSINTPQQDEINGINAIY